MKPGKPTVERIFIARANLWSNVYGHAAAAHNGNNGTAQFVSPPEKQADEAVKFYDVRFNKAEFEALYDRLAPEPVVSGTDRIKTNP